MKNQTGQSVIEALFAGTATVVSMSLLLMMLYRGLVYFTARYCLNDLLFCLTSLSAQATCESEFKAKTKRFLIFSESSNLRVTKNSEEIKVGFFVQSLGTPDMELNRQIKLPLKRNLQ